MLQLDTIRFVALRRKQLFSNARRNVSNISYRSLPNIREQSFDCFKIKILINAKVK